MAGLLVVAMAAPAALAQTPVQDSMCADIQSFASSALGEPAFISLPRLGHGGVSAPEGFSGHVSCNTDNDPYKFRRMLSCNALETPRERVDETHDEARFAPARAARDKLAARIASCEWLKDWKVTPPVKSTSYNAAAEDYVFENPRSGEQVIARAERVRTGSKGRYSVGYIARLVVLAPKADEPS